MIFVTTYKLKPFMTKEERKHLMEVFSTKGVASAVKQHYVTADGTGGVVISEAADLAESYKSILNYTYWIEYEITPVLRVEEAVPMIMASLR